LFKEKTVQRILRTFKCVFTYIPLKATFNYNSLNISNQTGFSIVKNFYVFSPLLHFAWKIPFLFLKYLNSTCYLIVPMEPFYSWRRFTSDVHIVLHHFSCFNHNRFQICTVYSWFYWKKNCGRLQIKCWSPPFLISHKFISIEYIIIYDSPVIIFKDQLTGLMFNKVRLCWFRCRRWPSFIYSYYTELELSPFLQIWNFCFQLITWNFYSFLPVWFEPI
jgi:hypothetical protein